MKWRAIWQTPKKGILDFFRDDSFTLAAALAFYAMLSLAPLLVLALTVLGFLDTGLQQRIIDQTKYLIGPEASQGMDLLLRNAKAQRVEATTSAIIGLVVVLVTSTTVFGQLQYSLNRVFNVRAKRGIIRGWLYKRAMSLLLVGAIGITVAGSIVVSSAISLAFQGRGPLLDLVNLAISVVVFTLIFIVMFRVLPDVTITWRDTWVGGAISGVLFVLGEYAIGKYLAYSGFGSVYGAAGSLAVLLIWVFYSALIVLLGAELTQAYGACCGKEIIPNDFAEWDPDAAKSHVDLEKDKTES
jgi:membrane protein